jgi:transcriptional regulator with XRE-family HTH domain
MTPVAHIRRRVLKMTQVQLAAALKVSQPTVCRWERQGLFPAEYQRRVRALARAAGLPWSDSWFLDAPHAAASPQRLAGAAAEPREVEP